MRFRITHVSKEVRQAIGVHLWQIFDVVEVKITQSGTKYPRQTKYVICKNGNKKTKFYWYEGELLPSPPVD